MINRIKQIIDECVKHVLTEMFSDKIYHFTNEKGLIDILKNNRIRLTRNGKYHTDSVYNDERVNRNYPYYLSFTRIKQNTEGYGSWKFNYSGLIVRIEFNSEQLNYNYKGVTVDYFKGKNRYFTGNEKDKRLIQSEDRLLSNEPYLENIDRYITEIDVLVNDAKYDFVMRWFKDFMSRPEIMNSPLATKIKVFYSKNDFNK